MEPTLDDTLLTAYLDGELSPHERQLLEQRLAHEPELRQRLVLLEETWHCLDLLEQEPPNAEQIETTLHVAAVSVSGVPLAPTNINRFRRWVIVALAGIVLFAITFRLGMQPLLDDPSFRQMIERYDMYLAVVDDGGLLLLRQLAFERVFLPPLPEGTQIDPAVYTPSQSHGWISMFSHQATRRQNTFDDPELYRLFYRNLQRFRDLSPKKTQQIRELHRSIEGAPRHDELVITLQNYYHWFKSLQSYEKAGLKQQKTVEDRVADITALKSRLDNRQLDDALQMPSEIISYDESQRLAETLAELPSWQQDRLLNSDPMQIINILKQSFSQESTRDPSRQ